MSYDLVFWKSKSGRNESPGSVIDALEADEQVSHVMTLPTDEIKKHLEQVLGNQWSGFDTNMWQGPSCNIDALIDPKYVYLTCYGCNDVTMNLIIDAMKQFECPLYDPQVDQRFDDWLDDPIS